VWTGPRRVSGSSRTDASQQREHVDNCSGTSGWDRLGARQQEHR
jgi:hypothetical protein